jgi:hypothetical protein
MTPSQPAPLRNSAYYSATIAEFLEADPNHILGTLTSASQFAVEPTQISAWERQIEILSSALLGREGTLIFEYVVPRIGSRIDAVLLIGSGIFVVEFKVGEKSFNRSAINQVWDYALDLKNFHKGSHEASIVPILLATESRLTHSPIQPGHRDNVFPPIQCGGDGLKPLLAELLDQVIGPKIDPNEWIRAPYQPTPTIIEAAQALYSRHSVDAIARHDAGTKNLRITSSRIEDLIEEAKSNSSKLIVFVTGVPGAGKTLVGLNIATHKRDENKPTHAVFLSGNGPLVKVLTEALTRDEVAQKKKIGVRVRKGDVEQKVKAFIQNVHHFRDAGLLDESPPHDHVVIFDEAQRAWNLEMTASFMARKKRRPGFNKSEPEFLISYLDRHPDWAVVICLVGGGQEINRGEAGISAWLDAVGKSFEGWKVYVSPELTDTEYAAGHAIDLLKGRTSVEYDTSLHLSTSMRSFRAEKVSGFVKAMLDRDSGVAKELISVINPRYPIVLTRDLSAAKQWVKSQARGTERYGVVASSSAQRLKPHAVDVRIEINPIHWFLNDSTDTRSSFYLEDAATEFQVQGLELDWVCMSWDADLRIVNGRWNFHSFVGSKWTNVKKLEKQQYLLNAYRVLLTRARQGMVIFVPRGDSEDLTRRPQYYDPTFEYLRNIGIPEIV